MNDSERKELVAYRMNKANETLQEIEILLKNKLWNTAVNRMYYACYYAVTALLLNSNIKARTHAGVRQMFGWHYIKSGMIDKELGKFYSDIFDMRQTGDYEDFVEYKKDEVMDLLLPAKQLLKRINLLLDQEKNN